MTRHIKDAGRKVYLIRDNLKAHHSKKVTEWLEARKEKIAVCYLPPYPPELNPDEYLNGNLKRRVPSGARAHTESELRHKAGSFMRLLVQRPHHVKRFFKHPMGTYAA